MGGGGKSRPEGSVAWSQTFFQTSLHFVVGGPSSVVRGPWSVIGRRSSSPPTQHFLDLRWEVPLRQEAVGEGAIVGHGQRIERDWLDNL